MSEGGQCEDARSEDAGYEGTGSEGAGSEGAGSEGARSEDGKSEDEDIMNSVSNKNPVTICMSACVLGYMCARVHVC